jgi:hypothetical protein
MDWNSSRHLFRRLIFLILNFLLKMSQVSMKSANTTRVDLDRANKLYSESRAMGNPQMCPITAINPDADVYSRPLGGAGYRMLNMSVPECSTYNYSTQRMLMHENALRPMLGPCSPDNMGGGDFLLGSSRDAQPSNVYGEGTRGHFQTMQRPQDSIPYDSGIYTSSITRPMTLSQDAMIKPVYG